MSDDTPRPLVKRSVLDRAKSAGVNGDTALRDLAFNQLLARIDSCAPGGFMLKGAQALRVRQVSTRTTKDLDMRSSAATVGQAVAALRFALLHDLGDGVIFQITREPGRTQRYLPGLRLTTETLGFPSPGERDSTS